MAVEEKGTPPRVAVAQNPATQSLGEVRDADNTDDNDQSVFFLDELVERCTLATRSDAATESPHTGSSEWAGFRTAPELLEVRMCRTFPAHARQLSVTVGRWPRSVHTVVFGRFFCCVIIVHSATRCYIG